MTTYFGNFVNGMLYAVNKMRQLPFMTMLPCFHLAARVRASFTQGQACQPQLVYQLSGPLSEFLNVCVLPSCDAAKFSLLAQIIRCVRKKWKKTNFLHFFCVHIFTFFLCVYFVFFCAQFLAQNGKY